MAVPRAHHSLQVAAVVAFLGAMSLLAWKLSKAWTVLLELSAWWVGALVALVIAGYVLADFVSGLVHFLGDTFGSERTPVLGKAFIHPFREHHVDQTAICHHGFFEVNGNNSLISLPFALLAAWIAPVHPLLAALIFFFLLGILATNQFHKWAHAPQVPRFVAWLQRRRLILSPKHHAVHHTPPHDTYFCITAGWMNPILHRIGFFPFMRRTLGTVLPAGE